MIQCKRAYDPAAAEDGQGVLIDTHADQLTRW